MKFSEANGERERIEGKRGVSIKFYMCTRIEYHKVVHKFYTALHKHGFSSRLGSKAQLMKFRFYIDPETDMPHIYKHDIFEDEVQDALLNPGEDRPGKEG